MDSEEKPIYSRTNPFLSSIRQRERLSKEGSKKNTYHLVLDLAGSGIHYNVGDSIAIYPLNDPHIVTWTLKAMNATGDELVVDKNGESWVLRKFLEHKANITEVSRKFITEVHGRQTNPEKKDKLEQLLSEHYKEELKHYLASHEVWGILEAHHEVVFSFQELCLLLMPLLPRFYSIASARNVVGEEVHLTIAMLEYETNSLPRRGVCTHYLCNLAPMHDKVIPVYIQSHHGFTVPEDTNQAMIMIGPGTGVAPFRAFMQEREKQEGQGKNWLFFGEWNKAYDFFYEEYWLKLQSEGKLRVDAAFSRDQEYKVYVQDLMWENGKELYEWLRAGSVFYVCGDAQQMARDVEAILLRVFEEFGGMTADEAKAYLKQLRAEKRYLRDVY